MSSKRQPLAEVFGYLVTDQTETAERYRSERLCPFNNKVPKCTKDKAEDPLGVCSIYHENEPVITCPIRFRQNWIVADHAASFFFGEGVRWTSLTEVRLKDAEGKTAGNIDVVLVAYDDDGKIADFGALEIQAVYISGNVRKPFERYIGNPQIGALMDWSSKPSYPRPDYLSSSRKRLVPQLVYKGGILRSWRKKIAVALNRSFFATLPPLEQVSKDEADIGWFLYDLKLHKEGDHRRYYLTKVDEVFTKFESALVSIATSSPGKMEDFIRSL
ncbi:NotI family restriction endonuclease [Synechococcus sp. OH20]|uniref:NotI family restriction endonuclease n=1 Tax=Synechococcus sp. OH20 TaxID=139337 RepID=UPI0039C722B1